MKKIIIKLLIGAALYFLAITLLYIAFAFANYDLNAGNWSEFGRGVLTIIYIGIGAFIGVILMDE